MTRRGGVATVLDGAGSAVRGARRRARAACVATTLAASLQLAALPGCSNPSHPMLEPPERERARDIALTRLADRSLDPPVSVEQAERTRPEPPADPRAEAPEQIGLTVEEARKAALENNLDLRVQLVLPSIASEQVSEAEARFEALLFGAGSIRETERPIANSESLPGLPPGTGLDTVTGDAQAGVRIPLRTGGNVTIAIDGSGLETEGLGLRNTYDAATRLSITQPLLRGAGIGVNTAGITIAQLQLGQEESRTKLAVIRVLAAAETAYWRYYAAGRTLQVRYEQYERAVEQLRQAQRLVEEGVSPRIEVTRAQAGVSRRIEDIIVAETNRRTTERELKRVMNVPDLGMGTRTAIITRTDPNPLRYRFDIDALTAEAVANRMEMLELELQLAVDAIAVDVAENDELPLVNLDYSYGYLGRDNALASTLDRTVSRDFSDWRVGLQVEVPLGNQAARSRTRRAMLQRIFTLNSRDQRAQGIRKEVYDSADLLEEAWQRILAAREETLLAARTFDGEKRQFLGGVRTSTDVLDAADQLADAQIREVNALAGYEIAKVDLAFATGNVLGHGHVRLEPHAPGSGAPPQPYRAARAAAAGAADTAVPAAVYARAAAIVTQARQRGAARRTDAAVVAAATPSPPPGVAAPAAHDTPRAAAPAAPSPGAAPARTGAAGGYTVQLASGSDEAASHDFVARHGLGDRAVVVPNEVDGERRYAVVLGRYADAAEAGAALAGLPEPLRRAGPFVRRFASLKAPAP